MRIVALGLPEIFGPIYDEINEKYGLEKCRSSSNGRVAPTDTRSN